MKKEIMGLFTRVILAVSLTLSAALAAAYGLVPPVEQDANQVRHAAIAGGNVLQ